MALLEVNDLHTSFFTPAGEVKAVNGVSFNLDRGKVLGIVGESGSGKSVTAYSVMQILEKTGKIVSGSIKLDGEELMVGIGKYGPYVRYGKSFASLAKTDDPYTIGYDRAVEIVRAHQAAAAAANTPLKSFPEDADMLVKNGRYGPYIAYKGKNYRLPKGAKPEELTLDDCLKIVAGSKK